ncbi:hypothetical protein V8F33_007347 [Rhypophila sp. PSN 637]
MYFSALVNLGTAALATSLAVNPKPAPAIANVTTHIISRGTEELHGAFVKHCIYNTGLFDKDHPAMYGRYVASCTTNTWLDITNCFVNMNGKMSWLAHGGAMVSCRDCHSPKNCDRDHCHIITCHCDSGAANGNQLIENTVNLNDGIYVQNGRLTCFGIEGKKEGDH